MLAIVCPYCASPAVISQAVTPDRPPPSFAIGFVIDQTEATRLVRKWIAGAHIFSRSDFKRAAPQSTRGVYLPAYLYGAVADSSYTAEIGEDYTETETYTTTDGNGKTVTRTRTVTKTEWRNLRGTHACYVVDVIVTASQGTNNAALEAIEPFDLRSLRRYAPDLVTGWLAEAPSRTQADCFEMAHGETIAKVGVQLRQFMPGDSHRNLNYQTQLSREVIDLVLLPIWSFAVRYDNEKPPVQILVNGQTGRVAGRVPVSSAKVIAAVIVAVIVIGSLVLFASR